VPLTETTAAEYGISHRLSVNARAAGPRLGKGVQQAIQAARSGDWSEIDGVVTAGGIALEPGEYELVVETTGRSEGEALAVLASGGFVILDTTTNDALEAEGLARDVIRAVQDTRKAAGFDVSDRIRLVLAFDDAADAGAVTTAFDVADVAGETLAVQVLVRSGDDEYVRRDVEGDPSSEFDATVAAGTYANRGDLRVGVSRIGGRA